MKDGGFYSVSRTVPGYAGVRGSATNNATVTVNGNTAWRLGEYFYGGDEADNAASAVMKELDITAVVNPSGTNEKLGSVPNGTNLRKSLLHNPNRNRNLFYGLRLGLGLRVRAGNRA